MNCKSLIYTAIVAVALITPKISAQQTKLLTADKHNEYGLVYTLPRTALTIEVTAEHTISKAGPYMQYAKKFIGTDQVIREDSEVWKITDVKVSQYGVADSEDQYLMQLKPGAVTYICVDDNGMLRAINKEIPSASLPTRAGTAQPGVGVKPLKVPDMKAYLKYMNEDFIASQSSASRARMLAESLMEVRDAKIALTRGTAETMPTDGRQLELMLASLADQEEAMTEAFKGASTSETVTRTYTFIPEDNGRQVLFRMSDFAGFVGPDDFSGDPVYISVEVTREGELPVDAKGEEKKLPKDAVMYNIPGAAKITISSLNNTLYEREMEFAQFGVRFGLNPTLFSAKKDRSYAVFSPVTGAIESIGDVAGE